MIRIDLREIRNQLIYKLYQYMKVPVIPQDQPRKKPPYPFMTYKFIVPYKSFEHQGNYLQKLVHSSDERFKYDIEETLELQPQMTLSLNAYCKGKIDNQMIAYETAKKARDWFEFIGYQDLKDINVVVVGIEAFGDRTTLIVDDYEARVGFDVVLRTTDILKKRFPTIEKCKVNYE